MTPHYDALIVGASIAGCLCALELSRKNWRVAVVEQRSDLLHYKKICTHIIHPGGFRKLQELGITEPNVSPSAQATAMKLMHEDLHAFFPFGGHAKAANIERRDIDPALKNLLEQDTNITLYTGYKVQSLVLKDHRVTGVTCRTQNGEKTLHAELFIAADGRHSETLKLAGASEYKQENGRVALFTYLDHPESRSSEIENNTGEAKDSLIWALKDGEEYIGYFPNRRRILLSWYLSREDYARLPEPNEEAFESVLEFIKAQGIALGPAVERVAVAKQTSPLRSTNAMSGLVSVGDAKLAADPLTGVGCSWAISSASLLARCLPERPMPLSRPLPAQRLKLGISLYNVLHALKYRAPSYLMTLLSMHGKWLYKRPLFKLAAWLTARRNSAG